MRERTNRERAIHPRSTKKPMFRPRHVTCSRIHQGWIQKAIEYHYQKSHQRSQSTGCVLVRKAQTNASKASPLGQGRLMVQGILPGESCDVKSTWSSLTSWGPVTEARPLPVHGNTPWNESLLQYHSPLGKSHHQTLSPLWWRCDPIQTKPLL